MKPIKLENAPEELQERIKQHVEAGFEVLEVMEDEKLLREGVIEDAISAKSYEVTLALTGHATIINLFCRKNIFKQFVVDEQILDFWLVIKAMQVSGPFRNRIKRHIRTIERDIEKEKEQGE